jgi:hypothetical protein
MLQSYLTTKPTLWACQHALNSNAVYFCRGQHGLCTRSKRFSIPQNLNIIAHLNPCRQTLAQLGLDPLHVPGGAGQTQLRSKAALNGEMATKPRLRQAAGLQQQSMQTQRDSRSSCCFWALFWHSTFATRKVNPTFNSIMMHSACQCVHQVASSTVLGFRRRLLTNGSSRPTLG